MDEPKKMYSNRLKRIEGQMRGIQNMLNNDAYCIDVITQTSAVRSAIKSLEDEILINHLRTCAVTQIKNGEEERALSEILKVYKLKK